MVVFTMSTDLNLYPPFPLVLIWPARRTWSSGFRPPSPLDDVKVLYAALHAGRNARCAHTSLLATIAGEAARVKQVGVPERTYTRPASDPRRNRSATACSTPRASRAPCPCGASFVSRGYDQRRRRSDKRGAAGSAWPPTTATSTSSLSNRGQAGSCWRWNLSEGRWQRHPLSQFFFALWVPLRPLTSRRSK